MGGLSGAGVLVSRTLSSDVTIAKVGGMENVLVIKLVTSEEISVAELAQISTEVS